MLSALRLNTGSVRKSSSLLNLVIPGGSILARGLSTNANSSTTGKKLKKAHDTYTVRRKGRIFVLPKTPGKKPNNGKLNWKKSVKKELP